MLREAMEVRGTGESGQNGGKTSVWTMLQGKVSAFQCSKNEGYAYQYALSVGDGILDKGENGRDEGCKEAQKDMEERE